MTLRTNPTEAELRQAGPFIQASLARSNPDRNTLLEVLQSLASGEARLWLDDQAAAVTQFLSTAHLTADERIWHAGGDMDALIKVMEDAMPLLREVGIDRLVIEETRKGWAKALRPHGFRPFTGLVKELHE